MSMNMDNESLFKQLFPPAYVQRGVDYYQRGKVEFVRREEDGSVTAIIRGTTLYQVNIEFGGSGHLEGYCSCPVGYNCKHVVATLLALDADQPSDRPQQTGGSLLFDSRQSFTERWARQLRNALTAEEKPTEKSSSQSKRQLIYLLQPENFQQRYTIRLCSAYRKKDGSLSQIQNFDPYNTLHGQPPKLVQREDLQLLRRLFLQGKLTSNEFYIDGEGGSQLLLDLASSGRCRWQQHDGITLQPGASALSKLVWKELPQGDQKLMLQVPEHTDNQLLFLDKTCYLDPQTGNVGEIVSEHPASLLAQLYQLPSVPPEEAEQMIEMLKKETDLSVIPTPKCVSPPKTKKVKPTAVLSLLVGEVLVEEEESPWYREPKLYPVPLPMIEVKFDYDGERVNFFSEEEALWREKEGQRLKIPRQAQIEEQLLNQLSGHLVPTLLFEEMAAENGDMVEIPPEYTGRFTFPDMKSGGLDFSMEVVPELQQQGWIIETSEEWPWQFVSEPDEWFAELQETDNEWFTLGVDVELEGHRTPLLPMLMESLKQLPGEITPELLSSMEDDLPIVLPLEDGRLLPIPLGKMRTILLTLIELYEEHPLDESGQLRFNRLEAARLAELQAAEGAAHLRWMGGERLLELGHKLRDFSGIEHMHPPQQFHAALRDYQQQGLNWLQFLQQMELGGILADDMGLGKTVQTLAHLLLQKQQGEIEYPNLVIAPTSLMVNWRSEAARFAPELKVTVLHGPKRQALFKQIPKSDLVLTTYPLLSRDAEHLLSHQYNTLVLDEAQVIKNPRTRATQLVHQLQARHRLCLTGTPMENHLGELWSLMHFLNPGLLGDEKQFRRQYRNPIEKQGDQDRQQRLQKRIAPFMLRRTKQQVATELPQKNEIVRAVELEGDQRKLYETIRLAMHKKVHKEVEKKGINRSHIIILDALLKLRQVCCDPRLLKLESAKKEKRSAKLDMLMDFLPEMIEEGRRILLFSQFTSMLKLIEEALQKRKIDYVKLTGNTKDRGTPVERFQAGEVPLFLISLKAGGTGLNLTAADTVIHYDPWWNPATENQATDRAYRIGQDKPVFVYKFIAANTVEEKIMEMQQRKQALADGLYGAEKVNLGATFSPEELQALFDLEV